jgi:mono/diheme cytochrome c family protein
MTSRNLRNQGPSIFILCQFLLLLLLIPSCNSESENTKTKNKENSAAISVQVENSGSLLYKKHCLACHQSKGAGTPGMFPPLAGNSFVAGEPDSVIETILYGKQGKVEINGKVYSGVMAPFKHLSDEDIALLVNYIRSQFAGITLPVGSEEIKKVREKRSN